VTLKAENVTAILGPEAGVAEGKQHVQDALSSNSRATLGFAKKYAEAKA
jgi:aromatase